jgi:para-aminobenzoate synthetase/4-amino-4-deoxychorismate lyase
MRESAEYFGFAFDRPAAEKALGGAAVEGVVVRIELERDGGLRIETRPLPEVSDRPVILEVDDEPVDPTDVFLFHKTTERRAYDTRRARHPNADDVIMVNTRGEITETTIANIAVKLGGRWLTPARTCGLLDGTFRAELLESGELSERPISLEELHRAQDVQVLSSVRGRRKAEVAT